MAFGLRNATITKLYDASASTPDDYGSVILGIYTILTCRGWLEETQQEARAIGGDSAQSGARFICDRLDSIDEGDILEITPDKVGSEATPTAKKWRIERISKYTSSTRQKKRVRRIELDLIEEK
ncbi:MAG: hypothetical protein V2A69_15960 [Pseudomonadota bacterium]